jgi:hypothetical protein
MPTQLDGIKLSVVVQMPDVKRDKRYATYRWSNSIRTTLRVKNVRKTTIKLCCKVGKGQFGTEITAFTWKSLLGSSPPHLKPDRAISTMSESSSRVSKPGRKLYGLQRIRTTEPQL